MVRLKLTPENLKQSPQGPTPCHYHTTITMKNILFTTITAAHAAIAQSSIFRLDGPEIDLPAALLTLAHAVHEIDHTQDETEHIWSTIGEHTEAPLGDMIAAAYWSLTEWHAGQTSPEYAALSALGSIYSPGMADGPEPESGEAIAYEMFNEWFQSRASNPTA